MTTTPGRASADRDQGLERDLMDDLVQISFAVMAILNRVGARHDLSPSLLRLGGILRDHEPKMAELAGYLGLEKSTVTGLVDRAERRGLVRRAASPADGRAVQVGLTPTGQDLAQTAADEIAALVAPMVAGLGPADQRRLHALLARLRPDGP
jgi:DNA-binding MarR family transcriptional regulator